MPVPTHYEMMKPILEVLDSQGSTSRKELMRVVCDHFSITEGEQAELLPSGQTTKLSSRVGWATTYMAKSGLIDRPKQGIYVITDRGKAILADVSGDLSAPVLKQFPEFVEFMSKPANPSSSSPSTQAPSESNEDTATPEERISTAESELREALKDELLQRVMEAKWFFFETLVLRLLKSMGYGQLSGHTEHVGGSGDDGIDGIVHEDALGLEKIYVQAKLWTNPVGSVDMQKFVGTLTKYGATKGVFIASSTFTKGAREFSSYGGTEIALIDGQKLTELMIDYGVGVSVASTLEIKKVDLDFFEIQNS